MPSRHGRLAAEYRVHGGGRMGKGMTENRMSIKSGILLVRNWTVFCRNYGANMTTRDGDNRGCHITAVD